MAKQIYAVYDNVAQDIVGGLFVFTHDAPAVRIFVDGLNDPSTSLNKHPDDYSLICLGEIEDADSLIGYPSIDASHPTRLVLSGSSWKSAQTEEASK